MFGFFKKQIHEPLNKQHHDLEQYPVGFREEFLNGEDCDALKGATGEFGKCATNPIPVNGLLGTFKYLGKLRASHGPALYFHRVSSVKSTIAQHPVDVYETITMDGRVWDVLFVHMYHPRRSNLAPAGYHLNVFDKQLGDLPFAYGVDTQLRNFPADLPEALEASMGGAFARRARERIAQADFTRPQAHLDQLRSMTVAPVTIPVKDTKSGVVLFLKPKKK
ncbi:MAG: hypothetical protein ACXWC8_17180 [Limisphaerales bacterium]